MTLISYLEILSIKMKKGLMKGIDALEFAFLCETCYDDRVLRSVMVC